MREIESVDLAYGQISPAMGRYKIRLERRAAGLPSTISSIDPRQGIDPRQAVDPRQAMDPRQAPENLAFIGSDTADHPSQHERPRSPFQRPRSRDVRNTGFFHENPSQDVRNIGLFPKNSNPVNPPPTNLSPTNPPPTNPPPAPSPKSHSPLPPKPRHFRSAPFLRDQEFQPAPHIENQNTSNSYETTKPAYNPYETTKPAYNSFGTAKPAYNPSFKTPYDQYRAEWGPSYDYINPYGPNQSTFNRPSNHQAPHTSPSIIQRSIAMKKAMEEIRKLNASRQVNDAINTRNGPSTTHLHDLPLNAPVLVYREKSGWKGPYKLLGIEGESAMLNLPSGPTKFKATSVKPYYNPADDGVDPDTDDKGISDAINPSSNLIALT